MHPVASRKGWQSRATTRTTLLGHQVLLESPCRAGLQAETVTLDNTNLPLRSNQTTSFNFPPGIRWVHFAFSKIETNNFWKRGWLSITGTLQERNHRLISWPRDRREKEIMTSKSKVFYIRSLCTNRNRKFPFGVSSRIRIITGWSVPNWWLCEECKTRVESVKELESAWFDAYVRTIFGPFQRTFTDKGNISNSQIF